MQQAKIAATLHQIRPFLQLYKTTAVQSLSLENQT